MCCLALPHTGLPQTKLGCYLETRVNDFLKRQNHPESGEVTIRVVHVSDKVVEVKPGMKSRYKNRTWTLLDINKKKMFLFLSHVGDTCLVCVQLHWCVK